MASTKGHVTRVTGGDWHPTKRNEMLTCSVDGSVRLWNLNGKKSFDNLINQSVSYNALQRLSTADGDRGSSLYTTLCFTMICTVCYRFTIA